MPLPKGGFGQGMKAICRAVDRAKIARKSPLAQARGRNVDLPAAEGGADHGALLEPEPQGNALCGGGGIVRVRLCRDGEMRDTILESPFGTQMFPIPAFQRRHHLGPAKAWLHRDDLACVDPDLSLPAVLGAACAPTQFQVQERLVKVADG